MGNIGMSDLPDDVVLLICEELGIQQAFGALFSYALTSKRFAGPAIFWLYRNHNQSGYFAGDENDDELSGPKNTTREEGIALYNVYASRWALLWKMIIRSSLGNTAYPYCLYIRCLDFRNLDQLLKDPHFQDANQDMFFEDDMAVFNVGAAPRKRSRAGKALQGRLVVEPILDCVGESIVNFVSDAATRNMNTAALEDLSGPINRNSLMTWAGRLFRIQSITLFDGGVLNESVGKAISQGCPDFNDLTFLQCQGNDVDSDMAGFLSALRLNSLQSFSAIGAQKVGPQTLLALNNHSGSLKILKLDDLTSEGIRNLSFLRGCDALEVLLLKDYHGVIDLEATENDVFLAVVAWLCGCKELSELTFVKFASAPAILTLVCLHNDIKLRELNVRDYALVGSQDFHRAVAHQTALESLALRADAEGAVFDDLEIFCSSISRLTKLKLLDVFDTSDYFNSRFIIQLISNLPLLEDLKFSGYDATDEIWPSMSRLVHLRNFNSMALSSYSFEGVLNYIDALRSTNHGLALNIMYQNVTSDWSDSEKAVIQESIATKVGGKFDFVIFRENAEDYDSDSD